MDEKSPVPTAHPSLTRNLSPHPASTAVIGSKSRIALRLFGSISLITIHLGVLRAYQEKGIVPGEQNVFQAITQGIAIFLGFNVTSSLKELATYLEPLLIYDPALWRVERGASREHAQTLIRLTRPGKAGHEEEEESEIYWDNKERFSIGSFQDLIYLAVFSVGMRWARFGIIVWLLLAGLGPSVIVALIGLNYNYESTNELGTTPGAAVNMTAFTEFLPLDESVFEKHVLESGLNFTPVQGADTDGDGVSDGELSENAKYAIAHTYGEMSMVLPTHDSHEHNYDPSDVYVEQLPGEEPQWKYNFREMNSEQMDGTERVLLQHRTSRSVTVMPKCEYFPIVEGQFGLRTDAPEDEAEWDEDVMIETPEGKLEIGLFTMRHADSA